MKNKKLEKAKDKLGKAIIKAEEWKKVGRKKPRLLKREPLRMDLFTNLD